MFGCKRTASVAPVVKTQAIAPSELAYAAAWGLTYSAWAALTIDQRRDYRDRVAYAPSLNA